MVLIPLNNFLFEALVAFKNNVFLDFSFHVSQFPVKKVNI